jgi:putative membrane protein
MSVTGFMNWNPRRPNGIAGIVFVIVLSLLSVPSLLAAQATGEAPAGWHAQTLGQAIGYMLLFAGIGILAAVAGYKLFDLCTPGDLSKEILEHRNVAAAIVAAAIILGVCIIIAAAMLG